MMSVSVSVRSSTNKHSSVSSARLRVLSVLALSISALSVKQATSLTRIRLVSQLAAL